MSEHTVSTLSRLFLESCRAYKKPDRMMVKKDGAWKSISTEEFETSVRRISLGFQALGLKPGDRAALLSENRPEWVIADFAVLCAGGVTVPIYPSLLPHQIRYIIEDSGAKVVVCSDRDLYRKVEAVRLPLALFGRHFPLPGC